MPNVQSPLSPNFTKKCIFLKKINVSTHTPKIGKHPDSNIFAEKIIRSPGPPDKKEICTKMF